MYTLVISKALHHDSSYPSSALADVMWADMLISCSRVSASAAHKAGERAGAWLGIVVKPTLHCTSTWKQAHHRLPGSKSNMDYKYAHTKPRNKSNPDNKGF